jgi:hypothetical protein
VRFLRILLLLLKKIDQNTLERFFTFNSYYRIHLALGFPLIKLSFFCRNEYWPDLKDPSTFNEKIIWDKLFSRNSVLPIICDKFTVREYVRKIIGEQYLVPLKVVYESLAEIDLSSLGGDYILKASHASGYNIIVRNGEVDEAYVKKSISKWLNEKYRFQPLVWFAQNMKRKILVETLLLDENGDVPKDYKVFIFNGKVEFIQVDIDRFNGHTRNLYSSDWKRLDVRYKLNVGADIEIPQDFSLMLKLAKELAEGFDFMRVDFYIVNDRIYFGELTPYPHAGYGKFSPKDFDNKLGSLIKNI